MQRRLRTPPPTKRTRGYQSRRSKRSWSVPWRQIGLFVLGGILVSGLGYLWFSNILRLNIVEIYGNRGVSQENIQTALADFHQANIFLIKDQEVRDQLQDRFPQLSSVVVQREYFPNKLVIEVQEKSAVILWHTGSIAYTLDETGHVVSVGSEEGLPLVYAFGASPRFQPEEPAETEQQKENTEPPPEPDPAADPTANPEAAIVGSGEVAASSLLRVGDQVSTSNFVEYSLALYEQLPGVITNQQIAYLEQGEYEDVSVLLQNGLELRFKTTHTIDSSLDRLQSTLQEAERVDRPLSEYVDLRFEKVYGR